LNPTYSFDFGAAIVNKGHLGMETNEWFSQIPVVPVPDRGYRVIVLRFKSVLILFLFRRQHVLFQSQ
jgi:hypothetical protein